MVQRHGVNQFYTAPTAIRALMKFGNEPMKKYDLSSLRVLGTVGEPINPEGAHASRLLPASHFAGDSATLLVALA